MKFCSHCNADTARDARGRCRSCQARHYARWAERNREHLQARARTRAAAKTDADRARENAAARARYRAQHTEDLDAVLARAAAGARLTAFERHRCESYWRGASDMAVSMIRRATKEEDLPTPWGFLILSATVAAGMVTP
jgi:hypothetical protein